VVHLQPVAYGGSCRAANDGVLGIQAVCVHARVMLTPEEDRTDAIVGVTIPVDPDVARALEDPARREAAGRVLSVRPKTN